MSVEAPDWPLSLAFYTVPELDPPAVVETAAAIGCRHVGLRLLNGQPGGSESRLMTDPVLRRETAARCRDLGVTPLDANTTRLVPTTDVAAYAPFLEVTAGLGARHVLATGNDPDRHRLLDNLAALADLAAGHGLTVEIEFVPWLAVATLPEARAIVESLGRDDVGIALDALHFQRSRGRLADVSETSASMFRYAHLCDAPGTWSDDPESLLHAAVHERLCPGDGDIDLVGLIDRLPAGIPLALEVPMTSLARTVPAWERAERAADGARRVLAAVAALKAASAGSGRGLG